MRNQSEYKHSWYQRNREHALAYAKRYQETHKKQKVLSSMRYRTRHKEKVLAYRKKLYRSNVEKFKTLSRNYYYENRELVNAKARQRRLNDPTLYEKYTRSSRFSLARGYAKRKTKEWNIERCDYLELISKRCFYCDSSLPLHGVALDRLDNSKGYLIGNVVPCCTACNRIRGDNLTHEEMVHVAKTLKEFRLQKIIGGIN